MPHTNRYSSSSAPTRLRALPAAALRATLREGYSRDTLKNDVLAGLVVGVVALPLSMALAIAVGAPPQHGLYTAIVGGLFVALLGGSRMNVTGPTAAFIVILAPIQAKFGLGGLLIAGAMGGLMLILMGLLRMGQLIQYVPHPVTTGFTAGIAVVIAFLQLKDLFGLTLPANPEHFHERVRVMIQALPDAHWAEFGIGMVTLALLVLLPHVTRKLPAPLIALPVAGVGAFVLARLVPGVEVATIASRFQSVINGEVVHGIPRLPPLPLLPWSAPGADGQPLVLSFGLIRELLPGAFAIAMLGAIESLLSAVVADGMARTRHDPDAELLGLGIGNLLVPFFGGIPATGALARTATNIRSGGKTPVAAVVHALTVLVAVLALAPVIGYVPMSSLAALLLLVAWNMSDRAHFVHILKVAPRSDVTVLVTCFTLTVAFDMVISVTVGVVLAALLFMRRMAEVTQVRLGESVHPKLREKLPPEVILYDVNGPLFFGAAQRAMSTLGASSSKARALILSMEDVPAMDATGLVALESSLEQLRHSKCAVFITGLQAQPLKVITQAHVADHFPVRIVESIDKAIAEATALSARHEVPGPAHPAELAAAGASK